MSKFKYYIIDVEDSSVYGTDNEKIAEENSTLDYLVVIDTANDIVVCDISEELQIEYIESNDITVQIDSVNTEGE